MKRCEHDTAPVVPCSLSSLWKPPGRVTGIRVGGLWPPSSSQKQAGGPTIVSQDIAPM